MANLGTRIRSVVQALRSTTGAAATRDDSSHGLAVFLSIIVSCLIWLMISMRESYTVVHAFPIAVVGLPPDTALQSSPPSQLTAEVEGTGWQLLKLYTSEIPIQFEASLSPIDLLRVTSQTLSPDLITRRVVPAEVTLDLGPRAERTIPVRVEYDIDVVAPFDLVGPLYADPDSVTVSGAETIIGQLSSWPTMQIRRTSVNSSFVERIALADSLHGLVDLSVAVVNVVAEVSEFTENRRLLDVVVVGAPPGSNRVQLMPDQVAVRYTVPIGHFEASALTDSFFATVDYDEILADTTGRVSPLIRLPEGLVIKDLQIETSRLQYYIILE